jgi:hypothetical protein
MFGRNSRLIIEQCAPQVGSPGLRLLPGVNELVREVRATRRRSRASRSLEHRSGPAPWSSGSAAELHRSCEAQVQNMPLCTQH